MRRTYGEIRDAFFEELYEIALNDRRVTLLSADQGAFGIEKFKATIPAQFINMGIAEQNMIGVAAGLALTGKRVVVYAIIPFLVFRCYEQIRVDVCSMNLAVTFVGVGAGYAYNTDGPTHHAVSDIAVMRSLPEMQIWNPADHSVIAGLVPMLVGTPGPKYVRLDKGSFPPLYDGDAMDYSEGVCTLRTGSDVTIVATGIMVHEALGLADALEAHGIRAAVVDLYRLKPLNEKGLVNALGGSRHVVTLEENSLVGSMGSALAELVVDAGLPVRVRRLALGDRFRFEMGSREALRTLDGLDRKGLVRSIREWLD